MALKQNFYGNIVPKRTYVHGFYPKPLRKKFSFELFLKHKYVVGDFCLSLGQFERAYLDTIALTLSPIRHGFRAKFSSSKVSTTSR